MKARIFFEAKGQRAARQGLPFHSARTVGLDLPRFARLAFVRGYMQEQIAMVAEGMRPKAAP